MPLIRTSRVAAAIVMLIGMLMMQISIAACRCLEAPAGIRPAAAGLHDGARGAAADDMRDFAARQAHDARDDREHSSCDNCVGHLELAKKLSDATDHPRVAPFTPSALHLVLDKASSVTLAPARPDSGRERLAGPPQLHIRHCSYQL